MMRARFPSTSRRLSGFLGFLVVIASHSGSAVSQDALQRLTEERLARTRAAREEFAARRTPAAIPSPFRVVRANLHVHSELSHDSQGKVEEIVAAAKAAGTEVLLFTDHPSEEADVFLDGPSGLRDGVLLVPGAETKGLLVYPTHSLKPFQQAQPEELATIVRNRGGHVFVSHLEERMDWALPGITGTEIYNTHADFKKQTALLAALRNPLWILKVAELLKQYPQETFSALHTYPEDYLRRWDELCKEFPHTGIAANDAHQNVGIQIKLGSGTEVVIEDALGEPLLRLSRLIVAPFLTIPPEAREGDVLFRMQLDPYEYSLRHAGTYLLVRDLSQPAVWDALQHGRAYVAFDWIADARGFHLAIHDSSKPLTPERSAVDASHVELVSHELGSEFSWKTGLVFKGQAPLEAQWRLVRDGNVIHEVSGNDFFFPVDTPGIYRVELWLSLLDQPYPWILSNPFYVRP